MAVLELLNSHSHPSIHREVRLDMIATHVEILVEPAEVHLPGGSPKPQPTTDSDHQRAPGECSASVASVSAVFRRPRCLRPSLGPPGYVGVSAPGQCQSSLSRWLALQFPH